MSPRSLFVSKPWSIAIFLLGFAVVALIYLPGLYGGFLLDDHGNLRVLGRWLEGDALWQEVIFDNGSGPLGRPLSMATFLMNAAATGLGPFGFKVVNLAIHLACMGLAAGFVRELLRRDPTLKDHALVAALAIAFWWAVLPIHAATVLYVVQRMAQLSTLFLFSGLWLFVFARTRIEEDRASGTWLLWLGIPLLTVAGALSKENALLLPLLCGAVEMGYFSNGRRPGSVRWFFGLTVLLPAVMLAGLILLSPESILGGYSKRNFDLVERVLTQFRVLWTYVLNILVPFGPRLGLFHDNYPISIGLFQPLTTILAVGAWISVLAVAWMLRKRVPALLTGVLLFLFGHAMESSIFALEMVFLHRNYMPAIGVLLAVTGLGVYLVRHLATPSTVFRRAALVLLVALALAYCGATLGRALVWQSEAAIYAQELRTNPDSIRTRTAVATFALERGHPDVALTQIEALEQMAPPEHQPTIVLWKMLIVHCQTDNPPRTRLVRSMRKNAPTRIQPYAAHAFGLLTSKVESNECRKLPPSQLADAALAWLSSTIQRETNKSVMGFRYNTARLLFQAGRYKEARDHAVAAWEDSGKRQFPVGTLAFQLSAALGDIEACKRILAELKEGANRYSLRHQYAIENFQAYLEDPAAHRRGSDSVED